MQSNINKLINDIKGTTVQFSEKQRNFNMMVAMALVSFTIFLIFDLTNTTPVMSWVLVLAIFLLGIVFHLTRIRGKFNVSFILFECIAYVFLTAGFLLNEGINGPVIFIFFVSLLVHFASSPNGKTARFLIGHAMTINLAIGIQYFYPEVIQEVYSTRTLRFVDFVITAMLSLGFFLLVFRSIEKVFIRNQTEIESKSKTLEEQQTVLERALHDKEQLLKIIAHDLKSPLASIQEYLNLLENDKIELDKESRIDLEQQLGNMTKGASKMLQELMEWNSQKAKSTKLEPLDLETIYYDSSITILPRAESKQISITLDIGHNNTLPLGDKRLLTIVLRNILSNAVKFTQPEGEIKLSTQKADEHLVLKITDTGIGMTERTKDKLFKSITESKPGTANERGNGLGLYICADLIKLMKGRIEVKSTLNKGTEFRILLKAAS